ncbi:MAG: hypothetical protein WAO76_18375, partial [Georgfuchsia sp.]
TATLIFGLVRLRLVWNPNLEVLLVVLESDVLQYNIGNGKRVSVGLGVVHGDFVSRWKVGSVNPKVKILQDSILDANVGALRLRDLYSVSAWILEDFSSPQRVAL